jgi:hypothetical protein
MEEITMDKVVEGDGSRRGIGGKSLLVFRWKSLESMEFVQMLL